MKSPISIGPKKKAVKLISASIMAILQAGRETCAEQKTIIRALEAFEKATTVSHVTISGCTFYSDPPKK
jgi:hypothetical protein